MSTMFKNLPCTRIDGKTREQSAHDVAQEMAAAIFINGRHAMTAMLSPVMLEEFVTGFLHTEQIIKNAGEIESIRIEKNRISVLTTDPFRTAGAKKTVLSGCGGSVSYIDAEKLPQIRSEITFGSSVISAVAQEVLASDLHAETAGIHIVALADERGVIVRAEDIGRHNALDRVIGHGLRNGVDFTRTFAVTSGRVSSEMVRKCLIAGIPVIVSCGATTTLAVEIAEKNGLSVIGFVRGAGMNIYSRPERVKG
jgi:FdhD protein